MMVVSMGDAPCSAGEAHFPDSSQQAKSRCPKRLGQFLNRVTVAEHLRPARLVCDVHAVAQEIQNGRTGRRQPPRQEQDGRDRMPLSAP
jgi:hypothetical protein